MFCFYQRLDRAEGDTLSIVSDVDSRRGKTEGKITLEGTVPQRLDQLDKRETELLEELAKQKGINKKLKDDRTHYRKKCDEKERVRLFLSDGTFYVNFVSREIKRLKSEIDELHAELDGFYDKDKTATPRAPTPRKKTTVTSTSQSSRYTFCRI
jgi:predicted RNase H-like nuclease (RuvC/YqgF family)